MWILFFIKTIPSSTRRFTTLLVTNTEVCLKHLKYIGHFWNSVFQGLVQNHYSLLCVQLQSRNTKFFLSLCDSETKEWDHTITGAAYNIRSSTTSFQFSYEHSSNEAIISDYAEYSFHFQKNPYQILKGLFLRDFPFITDCHVPERAIRLVTLGAGALDENAKIYRRTIAALTYQSLWKGWLWRCAVYPVCTHLHSSQHPLHETGTCTPERCTCGEGTPKYKLITDYITGS